MRLISSISKAAAEADKTEPIEVSRELGIAYSTILPRSLTAVRD
jgi:hypothetical protein